MSTPILGKDVCRANPPKIGGPGPNYDKPHVPVAGKVWEEPEWPAEWVMTPTQRQVFYEHFKKMREVYSCLYCGQDLYTEKT
jgi:hypothetical protein